MSTILVRDPYGVIQRQIPTFTKLETIERKCNVGAWALYGPPSDEMDALAQPGMSIQVEDPDGRVFGGPYYTDELKVSAESQEIVISGYDENIHLADRLCFIDPSMVPPDNQRTQFQTAYDSSTGVGGQVIAGYVDRNLVSRPSPGITPITIGDPDDGKWPGLNIAEQARFNNLLEFISDAAVHAGGLMFGIKGGVFRVWEPTDRRDEAVFSVESGNLYEYSRKHTAPTGTHEVMGMEGEDVARYFVLGSQPDLASTWKRRIEFYRDDRSGQGDDTVPIDVRIAQTFTEDFADRAEKYEFSFTPVDLPNRTYGTDYGMGDIVTAGSAVGQIVEVKRTLDENGTTIEPSFDSSMSSAAILLRAFDQIRATNKRLSRIERNY